MPRLLPLALLLIPSVALGEPADLTVEQVVAKAKPSVVVITTKGREGRREGLGTGFVVRPDGLIATNFHVIGEGRPIAVETADGKRFDVLTVVATDRLHDLALIKIDGKDLPALELGDSDALRDGQGVVALGNPQGLRHSVVSGVVSGKRDIDGRPMIQLAIPLEPGNSGGPLLDLRGRVQGVLTLKSLVTANLGFASPVNKLKPLIDKPNPVAMDKWLTIGALDADEWKPYLGARWTRRAGRLLVEGTGTGFGGRSLCVWQKDAPALPFEVAVGVKLDDERGAAGLMFHTDDEQRHYGFYPTGGGLRLTRFDGPDVLTWVILKQVQSEHYRPGEFNALRVRLTDKGVQCFVNDHLVIESDDIERTAGRVGLVKFRDTAAEFKGFRAAKEIGPTGTPPEVRDRVVKAVELLDPAKEVPNELLRKLDADHSPDVLRDEAKALEVRAARLRELADRVRRRKTLDALAAELAKSEAKADLIRAALLIAKLDNEELDVDAYRAEVDALGRKFLATLPKDADGAAKLAALNRFFFADRGFHGSRSDYYHKANSYLSSVIDDREGLPITLAILYAELGRRAGLELEGVGLPGHFVVRQRGGEFIDVFENGKSFTEDEARDRVKERVGEANDALLEPMKKKDILVRIVRNLLGVAQEDKDADAALRYLDAVVVITPESGSDRFLRAALRFQKGMKREALEDIEYLAEHPSDDVEPRRLEQLRRALTE